MRVLAMQVSRYPQPPITSTLHQIDTISPGALQFLHLLLWFLFRKLLNLATLLIISTTPRLHQSDMLAQQKAVQR